MGRPKQRNRHLPVRMQLKHGAYDYTPAIDGKMKWFRLSRDYGEALKHGADYEGQRIHQGTAVGDALDRYIAETLPKKNQGLKQIT